MNWLWLTLAVLDFLALVGALGLFMCHPQRWDDYADWDRRAAWRRRT